MDKRITLWIDEETHARLQKIKERYGVTIGAIVRAALKNFRPSKERIERGKEPWGAASQDEETRKKAGRAGGLAKAAKERGTKKKKPPA